MQYIRRSQERGHANFGWLDSHHTFSFGRYYDPNHMGLSVLRVINDDVVQPGRGFDTHGHKDMEIISYVVSGALAHKDSEGNSDVIPAGDVQRMSAGRGIYHSEYNPSETDPVNFLQIWVLPQKHGIAPSYEQKTVPQGDAFTLLVSPKGDDGSVSINQDIKLYRLMLPEGQNVPLDNGNRMGYLHLIKGQIEVEGNIFHPGDGFATAAGEALSLTSQADVEALWFDLPA